MKIAPLFFIRMLGALFVFLVQILIARKLKIEDVGMLNFYLSLFTFLVVTGNLGVSKTLLQNIAVKSDGSSYVIRFGLKWNMNVQIVLAAILVFISITFLDINSVEFQLIILFIIALPVVSAIYILSDVYKAKGYLYTSILYWNFIFNVCILIYLYFTSAVNILFIPVIFASVAFILLGYDCISRKSKMDLSEWNFNVSEFHKTRVEFSQTAFVEEGIRWLPILIVGFYSFENAAIYNVGLRISMLFNMLLMVLNIFAPNQVGTLLEKSDWNGLRSLINKFTFIMTSVGITLVIGTVFFGQNLISWFGASFSEAYYLTIILTLGVVLNGMFGPIAVILQVLGYQREVKQTSIRSLLILIIGLIVIGKSLSIISISVMLASCYRSFSLYFFIRRIVWSK